MQPPASRPYEMHQSDLLRNTRRRLARDGSPQIHNNGSVPMESSDAGLPPAVQLARAREVQMQQIQTGELYKPALKKSKQLICVCVCDR